MSSLNHEVRSLQRRTGMLAAAVSVALLLLAGGGPGPTRAAAAAAPPLDVHYVPTPHDLVQRMLAMANVGEEDFVIDLGSGDGRIVIAAVKDRYARAALGIDLDPQRVAEAREHARVAGVEDRVSFEEGDLFEKDFSDATVLTMYLLPELNERLRPIILERMAPGTRIVSHAFDMGDWLPDRHEVVRGRTAYLWIVPARVAGEWQFNTGDGHVATLSVTQAYQQFEGQALIDGTPTALTETMLRGDEISFSIGSDRYVGRVEGDTIVPVQGRSGAPQAWYARRL